MNNQEKNIEDIVGAATQDARDVHPSPELLRATLAKIQTPVPSERYGVSFFFSKTSLLLAAAAFILVAGGAAFVERTAIAPGSNQPVVSMTNPNDTSDKALVADVSQIDSQLNGLSEDSANTDQVLDKYQASHF